MHLKNDLCLRDSFADRVCDDLSEVILQFLPLRDKLGLECVSKQFQRTIYQKEYELKVDQKLVKDKKIFETVLKKCLNVNSIDLFDLSYILDSKTNLTADDFFESIITYCHKLLKIKCDFTQMSSETLDKLIEKFGLKLWSITVENSKNIESLSECGQVSKLVQLRAINKHIGSLALENILSLEVKRLKELSYDGKGDDVKLFQTFVDNNQSLRRLSIGGYNYKRKEVISLLSHISRLKHLVELKIWTNIGLNDNSLAEPLQHLADSCNQLKSLKCHLNINAENASKVNDLLSALKRFRQLKRLDLKISYDDDLDPNSVQEFSCKAFKGFTNLTHLTIGFPFLYSVNEILLTDIDINLPNIQYLFVQNGLRATEWTVDILNRLSKLKTIIMFVTNKKICETMNKKISEKNRKINYLSVGTLDWGLTQ